MNNLSRYLFLLLISLGFAQCDYERIEVPSPCPDDTNPNCPCPNPSNPSCNITFNSFFSLSELGCNNAKVNEVFELNNESGFMIAGRCEDKGMLVHLSQDGSEIICSGSFELETDFNYFTSITKSNSRLVVTGYTLGGNNTNVFNLLVSPTACNQGDATAVDNITPGVIQPWDHGNSIIADVASNNLIVGGKWEGNPALLRLTDELNMGTDDIEDILVLDSLFFQMNTGVEIASVNGFPIAGHEISKVIQTGDNGFLATGFIDALDGSEYVKKAFLLKTNADFSGPILRVYDVNLGYKNTWGIDLMEVDNGNRFAMVGLGFNGDNPQNLANAGFPFDYPREGFDGLILYVSNTDLSYQDHGFWLNDSSEDFITCIVGKDSPRSTEFLAAGVASGNNASTKYARVKGYTGISDQIASLPLIDLELGEENEISFPSDIIKTADGEFLVIINVDDGGGGKGLRFVKFGL